MFKHKSPAKTLGHFNLPFHLPDISGKNYSPGRQPFSPGESYSNWPGASFQLMPWPGAVPTINALANHPGTPRAPAPVPVVNNYSPLPWNELFIAGFVGKSIG